jgi:hypothetical protein
MPSDLIRGWIPVRVKKARQNKKIERGRDSIQSERALGLFAANCPKYPTGFAALQLKWLLSKTFRVMNFSRT